MISISPSHLTTSTESRTVASSYLVATYNETHYYEDTTVVHVPVHFNFSKSCKEEWTKLPQKISIASTATSSKPQCHPPCVHVYDRKLILSECSQVELVMTCFDNDEVCEKRIVFSGLNKGKETRCIEENQNCCHHQCIYYIPLIGVLVVLYIHLYPGSRIKCTSCSRSTLAKAF
ncbi:E3 ubiquitin-protein ligase RNF182 isoform X3 [Stegostoma tigrinum]|uniref:E3 ubiquitin-protein ligase RNF182 isoform X3 n=1 Tax=Stegostoma tigrinum TaxID=3053191 RepID=UPI00202B14E8|nr:E3 ubiquitin-protein ligase RNF182 isoform X3 [Stegostoma tigrinum]